MRARVVFDCMLYLQAAAAPHRVAPSFAAARAHGLELYLSNETLAEVREVLSRPALRVKFAALTPAAVASFLADVTAHATLLDDVAPRFPLPRDPKDAKWIDLAIAAGARYLVTRDKDLLDLRNDPVAGATLRAICPSLQILNPEEFVEVLGRAGP